VRCPHSQKVRTCAGSSPSRRASHGSPERHVLWHPIAASTDPRSHAR
jgi:hypothetical protein